MKQFFPFLFSFILLVAAIPGCSPLNTTSDTAFSLPQTEDIPETNDEQYIAEPDVVLDDELSALNNTGDWGNGQPEDQIDAEPEIEYDFPITMNKQVEFYLDIFQNKQRPYFEKWLARSGKYLPFIQQHFKEVGLPLDLAYLAMIESGFNPSAYSRAKAVGLWQFIKGTGHNYGLRIDSWVDERREPFKATIAAAAYLNALHGEFNDWYLAVAAYNAGEGKIRRAIERHKTRDFWQLARHKYLRLETKRYVPKLIAAILIAKDPATYGFTDIDYHSPLVYDHVAVAPRTDLAAIAAAAGTDLETIRMINTELRKNQTPPDLNSYQIKIPHGSKELVTANLKRLHPVITTDYKTHKVGRGDTLTTICRTYKLNKITLLKANNLHSAQLSPGQRLRIPYRTTRYVLLKEGESLANRYAEAGKNNPLILHQLRKGDTLSKISKQYNVPVDIIMQWNDITDVRRIRAGQNIALYVESEHSSTVKPLVATTKGAKVPMLTADKKRKPSDQQAAARITWYEVRNGDTLWTIARKFQVSARDIRNWNNLDSNLIHPGRQLVVKKG